MNQEQPKRNRRRMNGVEQNRVTANPLVFRSHLKRSHPPFSIRSIYQSRWTWFIILVSFPFPFVSTVIPVYWFAYGFVKLRGIIAAVGTRETTKWQSNEMIHDSLESKPTTIFLPLLCSEQCTNGYWIISALHLPLNFIFTIIIYGVSKPFLCTRRKSI